ncbi:hypothetical protein V5799_020890 [Amblyomma americanum]|uniref:Amidase domain-containing protein n=1 Tax=Amblyomma americanum TaxID=6943 RepID=A0AAQ4EST3_AMBAM
MLQDAGSLMYEGNRSTDDSPAVALMRAAGAIPLLVTNVPELCIWGDTHNLLYGTTVNPHDTRRGPGGSSGGEGSLLASAGSLIGLGTDMVGGVRIPAAYCGVFSHKPTSGMRQDAGSLLYRGRRAVEDAPAVSRMRAAGAIPLVLTNVPELCAWDDAHNLLYGTTRNPHDTRRGPGGSSGVVPNTGLLPDVGENMGEYNCVGPMTRFSEDLPLLLKVLAGGAADRLRLDEEVARHLKEAVGSDIRRLHVPELQYAMITWYKVYAARAPELIGLSGVNVLVDFMRTLLGNGRYTLAYLVHSKTAAAFRFSSKQEAEAHLAFVESVRSRLEETLGDDGVLILPAAMSVAAYHNQDLLFNDSPGMMALFSVLQVPATVCPVAKSGNGLPLAVQVVAKRGNDRLCLAVAKEIERHFGGWIRPGV